MGRYGSEIDPHSYSDSYYPNIFADEKTGAPNGTYGSKYGLSDQDEYVTGQLKGNKSFKGKWTYYSFTMSTSTMDNQTYVDLFSSSTASWLASRCVSGGGYDFHFYFNLFYVSNSTVDAYSVFYSNDKSSSVYYGYALRPIVEINLSKVNVGLTGDGSSSTPYSITAK